MNKKAVCLITFLAITSSFAALVAAFSIVHWRAARLILDDISAIKPGVNISEVREELGCEIGSYTGAAEITCFGNIKDEAFCDDKKMFWFYVSTPPCRVVEVYTDMDENVVYVSWNGL